MGASPHAPALRRAVSRSQAQPEPLYFGPADAPLAGWLHRAEGPPAELGLVICNPYGFEEVCAHRSLRHVAQAAAAAGLAALRFDVPGTGHAAELDGDGDPWPAWVAAAQAAADHLRLTTGVRRVAFFGVRLGAAIAAAAAATREDVAGLVAIAPVVRGRSYLRELRVLDRTAAAGAAAEGTADDGVLEAVGFPMGPPLQAALQALDLRALPRAPAPRVLIVPRDDMPSVDDWLPALRAQGADVAVEHWPGYGRMMDDPQRAEVPGAIVSGTVAWLLAGAHAAAPLDESAALPRAATEVTLRVPGSAGEVRIVERVVRIATDAGVIVARVTAPLAAEGGASTQGRPAVLMLNAGAVHAMGPNRLWVRLSRRWAAQGRVVMRLDLSGIGDSAPVGGAAENVVYSAHAPQDIRAALTHLRDELGVARIQLLGLCSGAYHALKAAVAGGPGITSAVMINPLTYFWKAGTAPGDVKEYELFELGARYRHQFFTLDPWKRLLRGELDLRVIAWVAVRRAWKLVSPRLLEWARALHLPLRQDAARELRSAIARGTTMHFVFARRAPGHELLRRKAGRALGQLQREGGLSLDFIDGADHTFTQRRPREALVERLDALVLHAPPPR